MIRDQVFSRDQLETFRPDANTPGRLARRGRRRAAHVARSFVELGEIERDELLAALETGRAQGWPDDAGPSPPFFETVRVHTLVAFLAHPKYGGNRDDAGWRVARDPGPRHHEGGYTPEQVTGAAKVRTVWGGEQ